MTISRRYRNYMFSCNAVCFTLLLMLYIHLKSQSSSLNIKDIKLNLTSNFQQCTRLRRPAAEQIKWVNNFWQTFKDGYTKHFSFAGYLDDRSWILAPSGRVVRMFPMVTVPLEKELSEHTRYPYSLLLWYEGLEYPISTKCDTSTLTATSFWHIKGEKYGHSRLSCEIPRDLDGPSHISLILDTCDPPTTYIPLVIPEKPQEKSDDVAVCVKPLFGNFTKPNATYLVSFIETFRAFGMGHVYIQHDIEYMDETIQKMFDYYQSQGWLTFTRVANNLFETNYAQVDTPTSQSVVVTAVNDCFYRNLHKYSYIMHLDMDEIPIPQTHATYKEGIQEYIRRHPEKKNASSISSRSAYFYKSFEDGNPSAPEYIPVLRKSYRTPIELPGFYGYQHTWNTKGTGVQKSFQSTETCWTMSIHGCGEHAPSKVFGDTRQGHISEDLFLLHHFRGVCQMHQRCAFEWNRRVNDLKIEQEVGPELRERCYTVLKHIGYFDD